jgi:redox-sensitive bicupin YhaK (pirin superfamily)
MTRDDASLLSQKTMHYLRVLILSFLHPLLATSFETTSTISTCPSNMSHKLRAVKQILPRPHAHWVGDGFNVYPVFANKAFTSEISPLLMFDYAEPKDFPARPVNAKPLGVGQHPHRGFETVTVAFQGAVEHHDSTGKSGVIAAGDVQWMTAGRGIIHQEYHSKEFTTKGGTFEMCQLWVNLPKKDKMSKPGYQLIHNQQIPVVKLPLGVTDDDAEEVLGTARIIAGDLGSTKGKAKTFSPVQMWDVSLPKAGSEIDLPFPSDQNCVVFVRRGGVEIVSDDANKTHKLGPQDVALFHIDGSDTLRIRVTKADSSIMVLGGERIDEPIASMGPFVMNTQQELDQAVRDYQSGRFGK